jgi:hypothetical protein
MTAITARQITAAIRTLHPRPVRLSVAADNEPGLSPGERFYLRLPYAPACRHDKDWLGAYLTRHVTENVTITVVRRRMVNRRDCGRDIEFTLRTEEVPS